MINIEEYQTLIKVDNNPFYYEVFELVRHRLNGILEKYGFLKVSDSLQKLNYKFYWTTNVNISFSYVSKDYQQNSHLALAINETINKTLIQEFGVLTLNGLEQDFPVIYIEQERKSKKFYGVNIEKQKANYVLKGQINFNYEFLVELIRTRKHFMLSPIHLYLLPIQSNNPELKKKLSSINIKLQKNYRTMLDLSEINHVRKLEAAKIAGIPFCLSLGIKDLKTDLINLYNLESGKFKRIKLDQLKESLEIEKDHLKAEHVKYVCDKSSCYKKITNDNRNILLPFNQRIINEICEVCKQPASKRIQIIKEVK